MVVNACTAQVCGGEGLDLQQRRSSSTGVFMVCRVYCSCTWYEIALYKREARDMNLIVLAVKRDEHFVHWLQATIWNIQTHFCFLVRICQVHLKYNQKILNVFF